ncbi:P-loop containing nucleoside triphosphate hydrolase protein [Xylaria bambusicola]|uniref:P-loop containing nucleoside triphosphate hydrolase protein n=1 Tax=Xylaria bambusicola TaxID=326684 RepID=UPI0020087504|nr:P-loop containing nucleoside triphosphate hydrolase protein [Xylaria bambusicola]KAI0518539.1 P-loop containing nucleoside triphosphate hydrolase protein [Xylaria bambusicola]
MLSSLARHRASPLAVADPKTRCRLLSTTTVLRSAPIRTASFNSGFTSSYDPNEEGGSGPMFNKTTIGVPQFYPRDLKKRVDEYVVGQDRAKKTISSVIFNHYQNLRRRQYQEEQDRKRDEKLMRQAVARDRNIRERELYSVEDNYPSHHDSLQTMRQTWARPEPDIPEFYIPEDMSRQAPVKIDKSNILLIGPTGVGKTYILETLSKKINVPFTICDCNSLTQAGYIGQDVETCIERLLIESNYDVEAAEHGIVVLDEFDKIAKRETMNGRDVGGEGVQQALLKMIEGTKVTINVKDNRSSSRSASPITTNYTGPGSSSSTSGPQAAPPSSGKVDQYTVDTSNILFVMCGAFVGLDKVILNRVSKPTMGFGSELRNRSSSDSNQADLPAKLFSHVPHRPSNLKDTTGFTALDLTTPEDLQAFGFIPELIGRVHNIVALSPLSRSDLVRILTEPRNSLVAQYTALFETYPSKLFFTQKALNAIAERAEKARTGARGLKMEMERVLAEPMFDAPMPYVLVTEKAVRGEEKVGYWGKEGRFEVQRRIQEEDGWPVTPQSRDREHEIVSIEHFREVGQSGA